MQPTKASSVADDAVSDDSSKKNRSRAGPCKRLNEPHQGKMYTNNRLFEMRSLYGEVSKIQHDLPMPQEDQWDDKTMSVGDASPVSSRFHERSSTTLSPNRQRSNKKKQSARAAEDPQYSEGSAPDRVLLNRDILEKLVGHLSIKEILNLRLLNKKFLKSMRGVAVRMDKFFPPLRFKSWRRIARRYRSGSFLKEWTLTGIRILDALPGQMEIGMWDKIVVPENLEFLQLCRLSLASLDSNFMALPRLQSPGVLDLSRFQNLRTVQLHDIAELESLDSLLPCASRLQSLSLGRCLNLYDTKALAKMCSLKQLDLRDCRLVHSIRSVAERGNRAHIQMLALHGLDRLDLDVGADLACMPNLAKLSISRCSKIQSLDNVGATLPNLVELVLRYLPRLEAVPDDLFKCKRLETLVVASCAELKDFDGLHGLEALRRLDLSNSRYLRGQLGAGWRASCPNLVSLDLGLCARLVDVGHLFKTDRDLAFGGETGQGKGLQELSLWRCRRLAAPGLLASALRSVASHGDLGALNRLDVTGIPLTRRDKVFLGDFGIQIISNTDNMFTHREQFVKESIQSLNDLAR